MENALRHLATLHRGKGEPGSSDDAQAFAHALTRLVEVCRARSNVSLELEALPSAELGRSLARAHDAGLLSPLLDSTDPVADIATYQLARALPPGAQKRMLTEHLHDVLRTGSGERVVGLLSAMVIRERRLPQLPGLWRQLGLCFAHDMLHEGAQQLALALFAVSELHERWLSRPAAGTLPQRTLSAQLLASAAFGAATRAQAHDEAALSLMSSPAQHALRQRLLFDREPLVWRLAALARGWLAAWSAHEAASIEADLAPELSPTEWRRAGLSLVASASYRSTGILQRLATMRSEGLFDSDRGLAAVMLHGLWGAPDNEATRAVGLRLLEIAGPSAAPELTFLLARHSSSLLRHLGTRSLERLETPLEGSTPWNMRKRLSTIEGLKRVLGATAADPSVAHGVRRGVRDFWQHGPERAFPEASRALTEANRLLDELQRTDTSRPDQVWNAIECVHDLQQGVLSDGALTHLLALGPGAERALAGLSYFRERVTHLLLLGPKASLEGPVLELQRERAVAIIRVLDGDFAPGGARLDEGARSRALQVLLSKLRDPAHRPLRRPLCAAIARGVDGLVRAGDWEFADALLIACVQLPDAECCQIMAEASMVPELVEALSALHACLASQDESPAVLKQGLMRLLQSLPAVAGPRLEALRGALSTLADGVGGAVHGGLERSAQALGSLEQLAGGLSVKLTGLGRSDHEDWGALVGRARERVVGSNWMDPPVELQGALRVAFPGPAGGWLARVFSAVLSAVTRSDTHSLKTDRSERLPHWLPATRELGDYIVLRAVGGGACGSVFLTRRRGQQLRRGAPTYALKVPEIGRGTTQLSLDRFLEMFRAEAGALASLPSHRNLAALESFDRSALPMPFLVMEHVQGPSLEAEIAAGRMGVERSLAALAGVARGLSVMHAHGIAHLDLKPSNVILRTRDTGEDAVLVDFGLAGRQVRAGCGTHAYAAPEVFGEHAAEADPCAADVYSFAVLAYEVLTSKPLFPGPTEIAYIAQHLSHDGDPQGLTELEQDASRARIMPLLRNMLRQNPADRCAISTAVDVLTALLEPPTEPPPLPFRSGHDHAHLGPTC